MRVNWLTENFDYKHIFLAGDVGGTNTNLALVGMCDREYSIILEGQWSSRELEGIINPLDTILNIAYKKDHSLVPVAGCISAAGPIENNCCSLTNCDWIIDGKLISSLMGIDVSVINDFMAISHAVTILDINDSNKILRIPHCDGSLPDPDNGVKLILGPGTGLGVGYTVPYNGGHVPFPSEGGHSDFADFDEETRDLKEFVTRKENNKPGVEQFVSGQGLLNIYKYYREIRKIKEDDTILAIDSVPDYNKPELISKFSVINHYCQDMMCLFIKMLASFAGSLSTVFLPSGGVYLAGGIPAKNNDLILRNDLFMRYFENNYRINISSILKRLPVFVLQDYSISIYGAAHSAAINMNNKYNRANK